MAKHKSLENLPQKEIRAKVIPAVYIQFTEPGFEHERISGETVEEALANANLWRYYRRRDYGYDPVIVLDTDQTS